MFFAKYSINGQEQTGLYYDWEQFHKDTFSPDTEIITLIEFKVHGKDYQSRKAFVENTAIEWSNADVEGISYSELQCIGLWFEKMGLRFGLIKDFEENGLCW